LDSAVHPEISHNIFKISADSDARVLDFKYYQIRKTERPGKTLLTILSSGKEDAWKPWKETKTGVRGDSYKNRKMQEASMQIKEAEKLLGPFHSLEILDAYTPLTIRDYVNSPDGSAYGVRKSAEQLSDAFLINRTSLEGLYLAGQNVSAPGILGTIIGSFSTVKLLIGPDKFKEVITPFFRDTLNDSRTLA
jgi:all-trans-retinol 13,14-reductase